MGDHNLTFPALDDLIEESKAQSFLQRLGFVDWKSAWSVIHRLEGWNQHGLAIIFPYLITSLGEAADPDRSLINFERFLDSYGESAFQILKENPRLMEMLVTIFSASPFLTEILLRTPDALDLLNNRQRLTERKTIEQFQSEAISATRQVANEVEKLDSLRRYQRRELLRIGANDFLGLYDLRAVFSQLSRMAIGLVRACLALAVEQTDTAPGSFVVLAVGKLGGWELNYSSDIDLLFAARKNTDDYQALTEQLIKNITSTTAEGFLYRVDLRLRPWGNDGPLISSMDAYLKYIQTNARLWEKQAFLKARPIAGNLSVGEELRKQVEPLLFSAPADKIRADIYGMKQRTEEILRERGRRWGEVKLGEGSIRDIEFVVQFLQMTHPAVRTRATIKAIAALREQNLLTAPEAHTLTDGYNFLRTIEHYLQMIDYRQTYTLPSDSTALALLARRLGFKGSQAGEQFIESYKQHSSAIRAIFLKYVGNEPVKEINELANQAPGLLQHLARMDASYSSTFSPDEIMEHARLAARLEKESIAIVEAVPLEAARWRITVVGYDAPGELSIICGLMFVYGLDIIESQVFTYEPVTHVMPARSNRVSRSMDDRRANPNKPGKRKIVDVFIVRSVKPESPTPEMWSCYGEDLRSLFETAQAGQHRQARGELAKRVGEVFQELSGITTPLYPIDVEIDNLSSDLYTILKIGTQDTVGFLYEFSNALAMNQIQIARMFVQSVDKRVNDTIFVTDEHNHKITSPEKQRELRAATVLIKHFTHLLPHSPNPEAALLHFRELLAKLFDQPDWPDELARLEQPEVLDALARLLGMSDFLWDDFLRMQYSNLFPVVSNLEALASTKDRQKLRDELDGALLQTRDWRGELNAYKDREMFRIDMRHILGYSVEFWDFSQALTNLVEAVLLVSFNHCIKELTEFYGEPILETGQACQVAIFALGKFGGRELGFASDIELMLIYAGNGKTDGKASISNNEYFDELVRRLVDSIQARQEGIFHIDLQLRPYGKAGSLAVSVEAFQNYFAPQGPAWVYERQALVKMRLHTGDADLGQKVCRLRDEFVYNGQPFDVTAMHAMRERQVRHLVTAGVFNAKYSPGALVDLEYLIQGLQITHGAANPALRSTNTRAAMAALAEAGILSKGDFERLRKAYTFMRWLIDSLRVVRGNSKDVNLPAYDSEEFYFLARRLQYGSDTKRLQEDLVRYPLDVQELNQHYL